MKKLTLYEGTMTNEKTEWSVFSIHLATCQEACVYAKQKLIDYYYGRKMLFKIEISEMLPEDKSEIFKTHSFVPPDKQPTIKTQLL